MKATLVVLGLALLAWCSCSREESPPAPERSAQLEYGIGVDERSKDPGQPYPWYGVTTSPDKEPVRVEQPVKRCRIATASLAQDRLGNPALSCTVDRRDAAEFEEFTGANVDRFLVLIFEGTVIANANIGDALPGKFRIPLRMANAEAERLVENLRK